VRAVHGDRLGEYLEVTWLYRPTDTTLSNMRYPLPNELFMSDHCNCGETNFRVEDVQGTISVKWFPKVLKSSDYFVRQKYTLDHSFVTLKKSDFGCNCRKPEPTPLQVVELLYNIQDTILAEQNGKLEPLVITEFFQERNRIQVRRLLRSKDLGNQNARPNELTWTDQFQEIPASSVRRKCHIRFVLQDDIAQIPPPYNRDGQADCYYVASRLFQRKNRDILQALHHPFSGPMKEGFKPEKEIDRPLLNSLSLFSGGGNFDRGLEDGGVVSTKWVVEWDVHAVHTFHANLKDPEEVQIFHGSVDDALAEAIRGSALACIPKIGEVDEISAGSPCQGFSMMQGDSLSFRSLTNASKIASVAAFIDFYRPAYALLENVPSMTKKMGPNKDENVFSQSVLPFLILRCIILTVSFSLRMLCALVGMGYQVQQFLLDAWSFGNSQSRTRLFIAVTAPGLIPARHPHLTHSHPPNRYNRHLGTAVNGEKFGSRRRDATPFAFVSARQATSHLPYLGDGQVMTCIPFPDHRASIYVRPFSRYMMQQIPTTPKKQGMVKTARKGLFSKPIMDYCNAQKTIRAREHSKSWTRVDPDGLFPTFTTALVPADGKAGYGVHWDEPRVLTIMEARVGQGFPDDEIIVGRLSTQWRIIGNSVARPVALALGMSLREAWLANPLDIVEKITDRTQVQASRSQMSPPPDPLEVAGEDTTSPMVVVRPACILNRSEYVDWSGEESVVEEVNASSDHESAIVVSESEDGFSEGIDMEGAEGEKDKLVLVPNGQGWARALTWRVR
jgi:DNA (cytosine-5)-methyltransferase 1